MAFTPGDRVRIVGQPTEVALARATGTVLAADPEWDDHCLVALDAPATYVPHPGAPAEPLPVLREHADNLVPLPEGG